MEAAAADPALEAQGVESSVALLHMDARSDNEKATSHDGPGDTTPPPSSRRSGSPVPPPPPVPRRTRGRGSALVCVDFVEVYTAGGEHAQFDAMKWVTTADLRFAVATRRGVAASQVRFFCGEQELDDDAPVLTEHLSAVLLHEPEPPPVPAML